jgi:hypothetical protein
MDDANNPHSLIAESVESSSPDAQFPTEPFPCPACGQMLAPSCRVCVACRHPIDPAEFARPREVAAGAAVSAPASAPKLQPVRYPWVLFFAVLGVSFLLAQTFIDFWNLQKAQLAMAGTQALVGLWVFFDALRQRIPRPLRWGLGTMFLPVFLLPWYLARRRVPRSPVPFVEAEVGPAVRFLAFALAVFFLLSAILYFVLGPQVK